MPFKRILKDLVDSIPGANGAILADWEGESVDQFCNFDEFEMKIIGAHKGILFSQFRELHDSLGVGRLDELVLSTGNFRSIVAGVGADYVVVIVMGSSTLLHLALRSIRMAVEELKKEIY